MHYCTFFKFLDGLLFNFLFHIFFSMSQEIIQLSKASHTFKMTYNNLIRLVSLTTFCRKHYQLVSHFSFNSLMEDYHRTCWLTAVHIAIQNKIYTVTVNFTKNSEVYLIYETKDIKICKWHQLIENHMPYLFFRKKNKYGGDHMTSRRNQWRHETQ